MRRLSVCLVSPVGAGYRRSRVSAGRGPSTASSSASAASGSVTLMVVIPIARAGFEVDAQVVEEHAGPRRGPPQQLARHLVEAGLGLAHADHARLHDDVEAGHDRRVLDRPGAEDRVMVDIGLLTTAMLLVRQAVLQARRPGRRSQRRDHPPGGLAGQEAPGCARRRPRRLSALGASTSKARRRTRRNLSLTPFQSGPRRWWWVVGRVDLADEPRAAGRAPPASYAALMCRTDWRQGATPPKSHNTASIAGVPHGRASVRRSRRSGRIPSGVGPR